MTPSVDAITSGFGEVELLATIPWRFEVEWLGCSGYTHIDGALLARIAFAEQRPKSGAAREYDAVQVTIINRAHGPVASELFRLADYHARDYEVVDQRASIALGTARFVSGSKGAEVNGSEYARLAEAASTFLTVFHEHTVTSIHRRKVQLATGNLPVAESAALEPGSRRATTSDRVPVVIFEGNEGSELRNIDP